MISNTEIQNTISELNCEYNKHSSTKNDILYSKLAIMEFCGWIEQSFDEILFDYLNRKSIGTPHMEYATKIITSVYSFKYNDIKKLLVNILGIKNLEIIENTISSSDLYQLDQILSNFKAKRDIAAHTHTNGTTQTFNTPSVVLNNLNQLFPIMQKIETEVNRL